MNLSTNGVQASVLRVLVVLPCGQQLVSSHVSITCLTPKAPLTHTGTRVGEAENSSSRKGNCIGERGRGGRKGSFTESAATRLFDCTMGAGSSAKKGADDPVRLIR